VGNTKGFHRTKVIPDPRRPQGRRHRLSTVLAIAAGATQCGKRGYLTISDWAKGLGQKARQRFGCRYQNKRCIVPGLSIIRDVLITPVKSPMALPAELLSKPTLNACLQPTAATGASKTAVFYF